MPENIRLLSSVLKEKYTLIAAVNGEKALDIALSSRPDLILMDILMPGMDGYELCSHLKNDPRTKDIPVIFITSKDDEADETRGFDTGAVDYITKPFNPMIVEARVQTHVDLKQHRDHLGEMVRDRTKELENSNEKLNAALEKIKEEMAYRKRTEKILRDNEAKLTSIVNAFQGIVYTTKNENPYHIEFMNQALKDKIGSERSERLCHQLIFGLNKPCAWCDIERVFKGETTEMEFENPMEGKWYYAVNSPVFSPDGTVINRQSILLDITRQKAAERELKEQQERLRQENIRLRASMRYRYRFGEIIGKSEKMQDVYDTILKAAASDSGVIIYGESGTGKELVARAIHEQSDRKSAKLVSVNCGAIPENLAESELFGHVKGAFSGADHDKPGYLEDADGGTLFMDEIGEIKPDLQVKLLRAIEGGGYTRVGSRKILKPDFRIIAATSRDLKEMVKIGKIRKDFFYRIHIIPIYLPALKDRKEDIPLLVEHFLKDDADKERPAINEKVFRALAQYDWPGNVRELKHALHRYATLGKLDMIGSDIDHTPDASESRNSAGIELELKNRSFREIIESVEMQLIKNTLEKHRWKKGETAQSLGMDPKSLYRKIKRYRIKPSHKRS